MKRFKYLTKDGREVWVCEVCKKAKAEFILLGTWKLIARKDDQSTCEVCEQ